MQHRDCFLLYLRVKCRLQWTKNLNLLLLFFQLSSMKDLKLRTKKPNKCMTPKRYTRLLNFQPYPVESWDIYVINYNTSQRIFHFLLYTGLKMRCKQLEAMRECTTNPYNELLFIREKPFLSTLLTSPLLLYSNWKMIGIAE